MRTQFVVQGKIRTFPSIPSYIRYTFTTYGVKGFYSGLGPALLSVTPYMGLSFAFYETLKSTTEKYHTQHNMMNLLLNGALGGLSGGTAKLLIYPFDTVKKRLQSQTLLSTIKSEVFRNHTKYRSLKDCFLTIFREEGMKGFYRVSEFSSFVVSKLFACLGNCSNNGESDIFFWYNFYGI
jgi:solute carrier family 25 thiamine pyrophosphate transporter 19